jgi:hypothetical protein
MTGSCFVKIVRPIPSDIPRILVNRDPRNRAHIDAALELLGNLGHLFATARTFTELAEAGVTRPKNAKVWKRGRKYDAVIGGFFFLDRELIYPDNVILMCADCGATLEIRPQSNTNVTKLCVFCGVDRLLKLHWESAAGDSR